MLFYTKIRTESKKINLRLIDLHTVSIYRIIKWLFTNTNIKIKNTLEFLNYADMSQPQQSKSQVELTTDFYLPPPLRNQPPFCLNAKGTLRPTYGCYEKLT